MRIGLSILLTAFAIFVSAGAAVAAWDSSVSGTVVDVRSGQPVPGATIEVVTPDGSRVLGRATSDASGAFVVRDLAGGDVRLRFFGPGYVRTAMAGVYLPPHERLIEAAPIAMYPVGSKPPQPVAMSQCGALVQAGETADVYSVCGGP
jgi:hypothetical protein